MKKDILLIGGGGHCASVIDIIESTNKFNIVGVLDKSENVGNTLLGYDVIGTDDEIQKLSRTVKYAFVTVGQIKTAKTRVEIYKKLKYFGMTLPVLIAESAIVSEHAKIAEGSIVHSNAFVNAMAEVGICNILNTSSIIEHGATVGDFSHVSTNAVINGDVVIGDQCFIGSGAILKEGIRLGNNVTIAAGVVVRKDIPDGVLCFQESRVRLK